EASSTAASSSRGSARQHISGNTDFSASGSRSSSSKPRRRTNASSKDVGQNSKIQRILNRDNDPPFLVKDHDEEFSATSTAATGGLLLQEETTPIGGEQQVQVPSVSSTSSQTQAPASSTSSKLGGGSAQTTSKSAALVEETRSSSSKVASSTTFSKTTVKKQQALSFQVGVKSASTEHEQKETQNRTSNSIRATGATTLDSTITTSSRKTNSTQQPLVEDQVHDAEVGEAGYATSEANYNGRPSTKVVLEEKIQHEAHENRLPKVCSQHKDR
ncbi:unnamed protein product, partial [Amoebophrya sp. A25]